MTHGSLFSGIDGFSLAAEWIGWETLFHCEWNEFLQKLIKQKFKGKIYGDIKEFKGGPWRGKIDIVSGGEPCQPHSLSGMRKGISDERYLWPEYFRAVREIRPRYVVNENVFGSVSNGVLDKKIDDLESIGYTCWPAIIIPANFLGAWHKRKRVWLVAHAPVQGRGSILRSEITSCDEPYRSPTPLDSPGNPFLEFTESMGEPPIFGVADGIPRRMDIVKRLGGCGNAIYPMIAFKIFQAIEQHEARKFKDG